MSTPADLKEILDVVGPKRVKTPELEAEAHNLRDILLASERNRSRSSPTLYSQFGFTIVCPKGKGCSCP